MNGLTRTKGFSLTEILISIGILAVGILLVAGVFPVALHFATETTERTIATAVADEAFAKIQLYALGAKALGGSQDDPNNVGIKLSRLETAVKLAQESDNMAFGAVKFQPKIDELRQTLPSLPRQLDKFAAELTYPSADVIVTKSFYDDNKQNLSDDVLVLEEQEYCWSALLRLMPAKGNTEPSLPEDRLVQVTVFVCRRAGRNVFYYESNWRGEVDWENPDPSQRRSIWPQPVRIEMQRVTGVDNELQFVHHGVGETRDDRSLINDGYFIVDDETGKIYKVMERYPNMDWVIRLDRDWQGGLDANVWVIPPPMDGGASPCIGVFQRIMRF